MVTLVNSGGNIEAVASSASASCSQPALPANGFVLNSYTNGQPVTVFLAGLFTTAVEGATAANVGDLVYLSGASGQVTLTPLLPTSVWSPDTAYIFGQTIINGNGNYETVTTAGTSGASEPLPTPPGAGSPPTQPVWATTCGGTTVNGSASPPTAVVWKMSPAPLQQVVGTIVYYDAVTGQCTIDFQPLLNVGDVSSVALAMPSDFAVGGSPIVNSGVFMVTWLPQAANTVHAGPATGGSGSVVWRPLVVADIPPLPFSKIISGVNTVAAMVVGAGASLSFSTAGSPPITGVINANELYGVAVSATAPTTGQYLVATGPTSAAWQTQTAVTPGVAESNRFLCHLGKRDFRGPQAHRQWNHADLYGHQWHRDAGAHHQRRDSNHTRVRQRRYRCHGLVKPRVGTQWRCADSRRLRQRKGFRHASF